MDQKETGDLLAGERLEGGQARNPTVQTGL
jgi:hypothetical protein